MKKIIVVCIFWLMQFTALAQDQLVVDANASVRELQGAFNKIKISGSIKVILNQSADVALAVSASEEKYKASLKTVVENNTLKIYWDGASNWSNKNRQLTVYVSFKELTEINASGASDIIVVGVLSSDKLQINLSGATNMKADINATQFTIELSGASEARLKGKASVLNVNCSGASDMNAYELSAESCNATASGASDLNITVNKEINAEASGASHIYYKGNAAVTNIKASGVSKVSKKN